MTPGRARALAVFGAALIALFCAACGVRPAGTNDISLVYATTESPPSNLVSLVRARLAGASIVANVEASSDGVTVSVDRNESGTVDALLSWRGGIAVYELAPEATVVLADAPGVELETWARPGGVVEHYYVGPESTIGRLARQAPVAKGVKILVQALPGDQARTWVVRDPPRIDLFSGVDRAVAAGQTLQVTLSPAGASEIEASTAASGTPPLALARDKSVLQVAPLDGARSIAIPMGDDLAGYARARAVAALLSTPPLPLLTRRSATLVRPEWPLAIAGITIPFLLSLAWLFFVRRFDRAQPEPWWLVLTTFALGCFSVVPAALAEIGWMRTSEWLDPSLVTMGGAIASLPIALPVFALVIGLSEEGAKFLGAWSVAYHRKEFDEPIDGIVYGAASSLGFAAVENVKYFAVGRVTPALIVVRMFMSVPAHLFFGAIWGYALGRTLVVPRTQLLGYVALAALMHGAFDAFLSYPPLSALAFALNLGLATLFVVLLRQSLQHGVVTPGTNAVDPNRRTLFVVGSPGGFIASAIALHVVAALLFVASAYAAGAATRVGLLFVLGMSSLVTLLGLFAYLLSATMPLDAVLDDYGVTFAGATRAWHSIHAIVESPRGLQVRSSEGDVWIGPARKDAIAPIARALAHRLGSQRRAA